MSAEDVEQQGRNGAVTTLEAAMEDDGGVLLELLCDQCGCLVPWTLGEPHPDYCPRCEDPGRV